VNISVIIPALNESGCIEAALESASGAFELVVVDGRSTDDTAARARAMGATVLTAGSAGRGGQMDLGAEWATGEVLLFLHADTMLPAGWGDAVAAVLEDARTVAGAFPLSIASPGLRFRLIERAAGLRSRRLGLIYGDQAIFVRRESFFKAGGFRKLPLMEDVDCVKRLRKLGTVALCERSVVTSARRWDRGGVAGVTARNWLTLVLYLFGVSPERLYSHYYA